MEAPFFKDSEMDVFMEDLFKKIYPDCSKEEVIKWIRGSPSNTVLRVSLDQCSRDSFTENLNQLIDHKFNLEDYRIEPHPVLNDTVLVVKATDDLVEPVAGDQVVVVGSMCGASILRGADVYAPGVLAMPNNLQRGDKVSLYADPCNKVLKGSKTESCLKSSETFLKDKIFVGNGISTLSRDELFKTFDEKCGADESSIPLRKMGVAIKLTDCISNCPRLSDDDCTDIRRLYLMQNLPSVICGHVVDPNPGERILDMCAAPGGKTSHLASIVRYKSNTNNSRNSEKDFCQPKIIACDKSTNKIEQIYQNCDRLNLRDLVDGLVQDGTKVNFEGNFEENSFDKVLLDAPCSALGQRPQFYQSMKLKELRSFANLQKKLFSTAVQLIKSPGGVLVYSTCTYTLDENEGIVAWALEKFPQLKLVDATPLLGQPGVQIPGLSAEQANLVQRFGNPKIKSDPLLDTIGFFVAKFISS